MSISIAAVQQAALWVTGREGPYHCDPHDLGGATAWGVSIRYHGDDFTLAQLQSLSQAGAADYLAKRYWESAWNDLPSYLVTPMLAFAILEGTGQAAQCLQRALVVHVDGNIGAQTIHAAQLPKPDELLESYFGACMDRLHESPTWTRDSTGWERRQMRASLEALRIAS